MDTHTLIERLGAVDSLDGTIDPLQKGVRELLEKSGAVKDLLHGVWLGHPLHPVLTDIPIGAWTVAAILDSIELVSDSTSMSAGADGAIAIGLLGAVGSAITGIADWSETDFGSKRLGAIHGTLNLLAASLYTASFFGRKGRNRSRAIGLSMLGYAIASASAYLGGHLVFGEQVGVDHTATANAGEPKKFTNVIEESALHENGPVRAMAGGIALCLVRRGDAIHAITDTCSHLGGPLSEGKLSGNAIECPWHGSTFAIDSGEVLGGPATAPARAYDVRVRAGQVQVRARQVEPIMES